jgi:hypothetical protein
MQPGGNHAGIVEHQHVAGSEIFRQVPELAVIQVSIGAMQDEQPRFIALRRRMLRDQLRRQIKMKISGSHGAQSPGSDFKFQAAAS